MYNDTRVMQVDERDTVLENLIKSCPANAELDKYTWQQIRIAAHFQGVYGIPTKELLEFFEYFKQFGTCIEIASGVGTLAEALDIIGTDNYQQMLPEVILHYKMMKQPLIKYGKKVVKMAGIEAVKHYLPQVVFSSWLTAPVAADGSPLNMYGVVEEEVLKRVDYYVQICGEAHHNKRIIKLPHLEVRASWIRGRSRNDNFVCIYCDNLEHLKNELEKYVPLEFEVKIVN